MFKLDATRQALGFIEVPSIIDDLNSDRNLISANFNTGGYDIRATKIWDKGEDSFHAIVLGSQGYLGSTQMKQGNADATSQPNFIYNNLQNSDGRLMKRFRKGESGLDPHIDDYSFMIWGLISLYESTFNTLYLSRALTLSKIMIEDFLDENGGFFIGSKYAEKLLVRTKNS